MIKSLSDLQKIKDGLQHASAMRLDADSAEAAVQIRVAMATCGIASGAKVVKDYMETELAKRNIPALVMRTGCMGYCYAEPTIEVTLPGSNPVVFGYVDVKKADAIIERYIKNSELTEGIIPVNYESINE